MVEGVEGAARIPRPPRGQSLPGRVVVAGFLAAVVVEEAPGAAVVGEVVVMACTVATEEE